MNPWYLSHRFDRRALPLANRHYNRQTPDSPQFAPPGSPLVLLTRDADAVWITLRQKPEFVKHAWPGAWMNTLFRNEAQASYRSSDLISAAVAVSLYELGAAPAEGMVTFVDASKTRRKRDPGRCYRRAGFEHVGFTQGGLWAFQLLPAAMPDPEPAVDSPIPFDFAAGI